MPGFNVFQPNLSSSSRKLDHRLTQNWTLLKKYYNFVIPARFDDLMELVYPFIDYYDIFLYQCHFI